MIKRKSICLVLAASQFLACTHSPVAENISYGTTPSRAPSAEESETPWTTWSENGKIGGLLVLTDVRHRLLEDNLKDAHLNDPEFGYLGLKSYDCSNVNLQFRTADGTCNDTEHPLAGAAGVAFGRNVDPKYIDMNAKQKLMDPNPALVSKVLFTRDEFKAVPFLNMLAASWIQFMNHDWLSHGKNLESNPYVVKMTDGTEMLVERTKVDETPGVYQKNFGKVSLNEVTHWWDASQIYGSNQAQQNELRTFSGGKLRTEVVGGREILPLRHGFNPASNIQNQGIEMTGFKDNWWIGLSMLHTLFVKEHNAVADMLTKKHVTYNKTNGKFIWTNDDDIREFDGKQLDEHVFQTARLIVSAILAKIHTVEWTPAILPNETLVTGMHINWYGVANPSTWSKLLKKIPFLNKTQWMENIDAGYLLGGIVGDKTMNYGTPFSITEEFTSVYRLHSLLPEQINFRKLGNKSQINAVPFEETRNEKSYKLMTNYDLKDLFYSFGTQYPGQLVLNNFPKFMQELKVSGHPSGKMDLGMVDILRDRERGVPRYNQFRRAIGLKPISSYSDFFPVKKGIDARQLELIQKFNEVYGQDENGNDNVEKIDLLVGTLAEEVRPDKFGFGETLFQIFILMASRRLMADHYFTEGYTAANYTRSGLDWIDDEGTMAKVILRHMPELAPQLKGLDNAFEPWNY